MKLRDILLALCAPLLLGFGFAIAKPAMQQFPPFLLMGLRFTIAALILVWWFPVPKKLLKDLFIVSLIGGTLTYGLVYSGLNSVDASSSILLVHTEVPFGVIIAYFLFKEKPTLKSIFGMIVAFIGLFILLGAPNLEGKFAGVVLLLVVILGLTLVLRSGGKGSDPTEQAWATAITPEQQAYEQQLIGMGYTAEQARAYASQYFQN